MKITSFNPLIVTARSKNIIELFEKLGFERRHTKGGIEIETRDNTVFRMKDENGFHVDVIYDGLFSRDVTGIRMNVDDFDEAYDLLVSHGFKKCVSEVINTSSSKFILLESPSGFIVNLVQHIKED